jgi:protein-L-isoaspartate(D-aspartate) O-methyltransferase
MNASLDVERARFNMVEQQVRTWEVLDQDVLDLLYAVPRERYVPQQYRPLAFSDLEVPLRTGATPCERMWFPKMEARVLQELSVNKTDRVLEIGTGSGYFAALLSHRAHIVHTVEISPELARTAGETLRSEGIDNVEIEVGDASRGWAARAPYDIIVVTSSVPVLPAEMVAQLRPGGRLFAVIGDPPVMSATIFTAEASGSPLSRTLFETSLAPLVNALQPERFRF